MANVTIADLDAAAAVTADDLFEIENDPAGTAASQKATAAQIAAYVGTALVESETYGPTWNGDTTHAPSKNDVYDKFEGYLHPGYIAGNWYHLYAIGVAFGAGGVGANSIYFTPFVITRAITLSDLGARVVTTDSGKAFALAIYANNAATGRPTGTPLAATGDLSTTTGATVTGDITGSNVTLQPGIYWGAGWANTGTATFVRATNNQLQSIARWIGSATADNAIGNQISLGAVHISNQTFDSGAWPDVTSASFSETTNTAGLVLIAKAA